VEEYWADGRLDRVSALMAKVIEHNVDLLSRQ